MEKSWRRQLHVMNYGWDGSFNFRTLQLNFPPSLFLGLKEKSHKLTITIKTRSAFCPPEKSPIHIEFVTSLLTVLRQWCGLMFVKRSRLAQDILRPRAPENFGVKDCVEEVMVSKVSGDRARVRARRKD